MHLELELVLELRQQLEPERKLVWMRLQVPQPSQRLTLVVALTLAEAKGLELKQECDLLLMLLQMPQPSQRLALVQVVVRW